MMEDVQQLATKIERRLKKAGVKVDRVNSHTGSVYLTLDTGLAHHVRISNHPDSLKYRYRYNMLTCGYIDKRRHNGNNVRFYYQPSEFYHMIDAILRMRKARIASFGSREYNLIMRLREDYEYTRRKLK